MTKTAWEWNLRAMIICQHIVNMHSVTIIIRSVFMWALLLLFFKDIGFKFEEHICNKCHDLLKIAYSLKDIAKSDAKGSTYRCILMGISKNESLKRLNNSVTYGGWVL